MIITDEMLVGGLEGSKNEPSQKQIDHASDYIKRRMKLCGMEETEIALASIPFIARRLFDIRNNNLNEYDYANAKKGVALIGSIGTGKTTVLKLASLVFDAEFFDVPMLSVEFSRNGPCGFWGTVSSSMAKNDLILDDLGAEADSKSYGNVLPIVDLIYERYNQWKNYGDRIWLSSNLTGKELTERYGVRVTDRIKEMCHVIPCVGSSMRS